MNTSGVTNYYKTYNVVGLNPDNDSKNSETKSKNSSLIKSSYVGSQLSKDSDSEGKNNDKSQ